MTQSRDRWNDPEGPGRVSPRECVRNAQEEINKAWCSADYSAAVIFLRGGIDWLRRALEQMV
jgi:hypothetical protein